MATSPAEPPVQPVAALPQVRRLRICLLGSDTFQPGVGKADMAAALLRGLTADQPGPSDPVLDLAFDYGVFERAWRTLLDPGADAGSDQGVDPGANTGLLQEDPTPPPHRGVASSEAWGIGSLSTWDSEGRVRFDRRGPGETTQPYDPDPAEDCASLCGGNPKTLSLGHKRSTGTLRAFREALTVAGQDLAALEGLHREMYSEAEGQPRQLVRRDRPCPGLLASFARFSPEVGELPGCNTAILHVFEDGSWPLGSPRNVAMLYAAAPNSRLHRTLLPGTLLCAMRSIGSNISRTLREYNRLAGQQTAPGSWERTMWWESDLRAQVEYYLSDRNLRTDRIFRDKILGDEEGWLDMELVRGCQDVTLQAELLGALSASKCVETKVADDGKVFVRRMGGKAVPIIAVPVPRRMKRKFAVDDDDPNCWDFTMKGFCPRGAACKYIHVVPPGGMVVAAPPMALGVPNRAALGTPDAGTGAPGAMNGTAAQEWANNPMLGRVVAELVGGPPVGGSVPALSDVAAQPAPAPPAAEGAAAAPNPEEIVAGTAAAPHAVAVGTAAPDAAAGTSAPPPVMAPPAVGKPSTPEAARRGTAPIEAIDPVDEAEEEKRRRRALRFGLAVSGAEAKPAPQDTAAGGAPVAPPVAPPAGVDAAGAPLGDQDQKRAEAGA